MTEKNLTIAASRRALNVWKYVHRGAQRTQDQPINQRINLRRSVCGGCRPLITLAQISTPFPAPSTLTRFTALRPGPLPLSHPFRPLLPRCSRSLLHLSPTTMASACIGANLPRQRVFRDSFRSESIPPPRQVETVGTAVAGVRRVQPSVSGLSFVSLVTAPHKGIAL